ncbi:hypothetical protein EV122DRAFT_212505 [Schizophyllum commune]
MREASYRPHRLVICTYKSNSRAGPTGQLGITSRTALGPRMPSWSAIVSVKCVSVEDNQGQLFLITVPAAVSPSLPRRLRFADDRGCPWRCCGSTRTNRFRHYQPRRRLSLSVIASWKYPSVEHC